MTAPFNVILCEGYHDRSFLSGALHRRLGWSEPSLDASGRRLPHRDRWGNVAGGDFGLQRDAAELRLRPCHGHTKVPDVVARILQDRETKLFDRLVINYDGDKGGSGADFIERICQSVEGILRGAGLDFMKISNGQWTIDSGQREVRLLVWHTAEPTPPGVPDQQCLERLICAASAEVWPDRAKAMSQWLNGRPDPSTRLSDPTEPGTIAKSYSWTLMGGWFAEHGCDDFFKELWRHDKLTEALQRHMGADAWDLLASLDKPVIPATR